MARSRHIYIVSGLHAPLAAFTVKREAQDWIMAVVNKSRSPRFVTRMRDGGAVAGNIFWGVEEFLRT